MVSTWLALTVLVAGCYGPQVAADVPCSPLGECPRGQMCISGLCVLEPKLDARTPDGRTPDGSQTASCDPATPFDAPVLVAGLNDTSYVANARFSVDELEVFFQGKPGQYKQLYTATRPTTHDPFGAWTLMTVNDSGADHYDATLSEDGVTFMFASPRTGGAGQIDIWRATRPTQTSPFGAPSPVGPVNTGLIEDQSYIMGNNAALWYTPIVNGDQEIYEALPNGSDYGAGTEVTELNSGKDETFPTPTADGTLIYFGSARSGGQNRHIFMAQRANASMPFGAPRAVAELNSNMIDEPSWISPDLCRLYLSSTRLGQYNVFVATR